ncbi:hypothetical protein, partial [Hydrogenophaga sp.]|uniref:hypothetical protein n=1 Tax=Hydrogenophaga sp. TaxID=1904254 RepID=UPI0025B92570
GACMFVTAHCAAPARLSGDDRDECPHLRARAWRPAHASGTRIVHWSAINLLNEFNIPVLNLFNRSLLIAGVLLLAGCAATVSQTATSPASPGAAPQAAGATLVAVVGGSPAMQASSDWSSFLAEWQESLATSAESARMPFVFVKDEASIPSRSSILVRLTVNDFRYVSTNRRYMLGVIAGNAYMDVDAQYIELPANKPFGSKKFNTSSSAWEGIFSAVTPKQVRAVSDLIVKDVASTAPAK